MGATAMIGLAVSAGSKIYGGIQQKRADDQSAAELSQEAGQSVASGIQGAIQDRRKATYVASAAQARTAGSGLATTSPTAINTAGLIEGQGEYNARTAMYQGEDRASELNFRAGTMQNEGNAAETAGYLSAAGTVIGGGKSFYDKYGAS